MDRRRQLLIAGVVVAVAVGVAFLGMRWNGVIPAGAGSTIVARTVMSGLNGPDGTRDENGGPTPTGQGCHGVADNPSGEMYACWETYREPNDGDSEKDYFHLYAHGSFGGPSGTGVNWLVARADLVGSPAGGAYANWPDWTYRGACQLEPVNIPFLLAPVEETLCGTTIGSLDPTTWTQTVTWTCETCPFGNHVTRSFALYGFVGVPEGTIPAWDIIIDYGT